jgi:hypothetical protein
MPRNVPMILIFRKTADLRQINATGNVSFVAQSGHCLHERVGHLAPDHDQGARVSSALREV